MRSEQEVLQRLILDTVTLLCRNTVTYQNNLQVQGLIGITIDSNVFIVHFDEKFDNLTQKETSQSKASRSVLDLGIEDFHAETDSAEVSVPLPLVQPNLRKTCAQRRWSRETSGEHKQRTNRIQQAQQSSPTVVSVCDVVKEEPNRVPVLPQPWPGFQNEPEEILTIPEVVQVNSLHLKTEKQVNSLHLKTENSLVELEMLEIAARDADTYTAHSQSSSVILQGTQYGGDSGRSSFQPEHVGLHQSLPKPLRRHRPSYKTGDSQKVPSSSAPYIITKALHICGYPSCGKQFHHRHHLLRHQTMKHNRAPTKQRQKCFLDSFVSSLPVVSNCDAIDQSLASRETLRADQSSSSW